MNLVQSPPLVSPFPLFCPPTNSLLLHGTSLGMSIYRFASLALAIATLFGRLQARCYNPSVRREWRSLFPHERAEWIAAVKVGPAEHASRITNLPAQCLHTLPHNSSLVPTFNKTYTAIPPVNTSGSYFDGSFIPHFIADTI